MRKIVALVVLLLVLLTLGAWFAAHRAVGSDLVRAQLEQQLSARIGQRVTIGSAGAVLFPDIAADLRTVTIGEPAAIHLGRVKILTSFRALFSDVIDVREVVISDGRLGGAGQPFTFDLAASVLGDRLDITSLKATGRTTRIDAKGALTSIANLEGALDATANPLDLNEVIAFADALTPPRNARADRPSPMHFVVKIAAPAVRFAGYTFRNLSTTIDAAPGQTMLDGVSLEVFGGTFKGRLDADTHGAAPVLRLTGHIAGLDVAELRKGSGSPDGITGRLGGTVSLVASGVDGAALLRTARGTINGAVTNGTMPRLDLVRSVVLAFGKPSGAPPEGSGTAFTRLAGTMTRPSRCA